MAGSTLNNSDRSAMITMFIVAYIICVLCAIIPLYGFFGLPDKAQKLSYFKVDKNSQKDLKETLANFNSLVTTLDSLLKVENLESRYGTATLELRTLTEGLKKEGNPYYPVFSKIADLYDQIKKYCENSSKAEQLNSDNIKLTKDLDEKKNELDDLKDDMEKLEDQLKDAKKGS
jgi:hypothetical protein